MAVDRKPLTIVLDLDETLINSRSDLDVYDSLHIQDANPLVRTRIFTFTIPNSRRPIFWIVKRPYLDEFLDVCATHFDKVIVWSAADKEYVHKIVKNIFLGHHLPHLILTREDCPSHPSVKYHKPLRILTKLDPSISLERTVIVDDRSRNFVDNWDNRIHIPKYESPSSLKGIANDPDKHLLQLIKCIRSINLHRNILRLNQCFPSREISEDTA